MAKDSKLLACPENILSPQRANVHVVKILSIWCVSISMQCKPFGSLVVVNHTVQARISSKTHRVSVHRTKHSPRRYLAVDDLAFRSVVKGLLSFVRDSGIPIMSYGTMNITNDKKQKSHWPFLEHMVLVDRKTIVNNVRKGGFLLGW